MPTPVGVARQCLTPEASLALDEAVAVARRRGHAQTTSLHAVSALLSLPSSSLLRDACSRARNSAYSPRLQFKALDLSLSVSLDRTPSTTTASAPAIPDPPISNSLMAAIKRSQANQRRHPDNFHLYHTHNHNQPFSVSTLKVELRHFVLSILDDPLVSRVFAEAGFRSSEIKLAILRPLRYRAPPVFLCNLAEQHQQLPRRSFSFPFCGSGSGSGAGDGESENFKRIGEVLVRSRGRNPLLLGACAKEALDSFAEAVEKGKQVLPVELCGLKVVCAGNDVVEFVAGNSGVEALKKRFEEVGLMAEKGVGPGVVLNFGDLLGFVAKDSGCDSGEAVRYVVGELGKLLKVHCDRFWLVGAVATYESYLKFVGRFPSVEKDWDLQLLPITSVQSYQRPRSSLMDSFVPFGGFFSSPSDLKGPLNDSLYCVSACHECGERCEHEVHAASKERFSASAGDPQQSNLPPWLQIAERGTAKGLNVKTKDDGILLDSSESGALHKNMDKTCQHPHQQFPNASTCPTATVVGFHCVDGRKADADSHSSKITDKSPGEYINLNSQVPVGLQMMSRSQSSNPFPVTFKEQEKYTSKLSEMFQKVEDNESGDLRSCNLSNSSVCDGRQSSPTSVTSVTTDLGLGICSSPTSNNAKKPNAQYAMEPPKEIPCRLSSTSNLTDGNILKYPCQSSSCLSFDYCGQVDARKPKNLFESLSKEVSWQDEALRVIVKTIFCGPTKRVKPHGANQRRDIWMNFVGPDRLGKKKIAASLAEFFYEGRESFIFVDLSSEENGCSVKFRGKTTLDFIVGEFCKKPWSVVFLENVDKADMIAQSSLSQAIKTGKITDSHGREVSLNNAIFVTSFSGYQNSSMPTRETSNYSEERVLRSKGGAIKIKVEHLIVDHKSQSICVLNSSIDAIPSLCFINKRKLIGENEFRDRQLISDTAKRPHTTSNWLLDLNLPAEENELQPTDDGNCEHVSTDNQNIWLQDLNDQVDETVVFKPYDFDALASRVLKVIRSNFNRILGSECALQVQSEVMDQLLAAVYVSDREKEVENWVEQVLSGGFTEVQRRYNLTASSIVKLATCPEQASSVYLPTKIILG